MLPIRLASLAQGADPRRIGRGSRHRLGDFGWFKIDYWGWIVKNGRGPDWLVNVWKAGKVTNLAAWEQRGFVLSPFWAFAGSPGPSSLA
ncbi:MAG: hypothetical protein ACRD8A_07005 [Candidatus Acidiferrales bacterium]